LLSNFDVKSLLLIVSSFLVAGSLFAASAQSSRPNVVVILADDLGYGDPGCYGGSLVRTPNIDHLAADGVRLTDGYVTAPVCGPSRCGLMTGSYNQRFGMQWNEDQQLQHQYRIPETHKLMPQAFRAAGYRTAHIGKWNVSRDLKLCFDETYDVMDWEGDYLPKQDGKYVGVDDPKKHDSGKVHGLWGPEESGQEYLTDRIGRHAVEFIERNSKEPFFLYLAFNAVHSPFHGKKELEKKYGHIRPQPLNFYAAMLHSLDENIGRVLDKLKQLRLEENTIVIFVSDNGPTAALRSSPADWERDIIVGSAGPLNGHKGQYYEGGIRVPYIIRWPNRLKAGSIFRKPVSTMDLYPTLCAAAEIEVSDKSRLDGINLLPYLTGRKKSDPHPVLFWKTGPAGAVRKGDWKLLFKGDGKAVLFNLAQDVGEKTDVAKENDRIVRQLHKAWTDWSASLPPRTTPPHRQKVFQQK
jgi:arylsulfatase A-like enzyme